MTRRGLLSVLPLCWQLGTAGPAPGQTVQTYGDCSPVAMNARGDVTINLNCPLQFTPAQLQQLIDSIRNSGGIPRELMAEVQTLSAQLGVRDTAVANFFRILGQAGVPVGDLDTKLREIAARHLSLLNEVSALHLDDSRTEGIKQEAIVAIEAGNYDHAKRLLAEVADVELSAARQLEEAEKKLEEKREKRLLNAAEAHARRGEVSLAQLHYADAAHDFEVAADLAPASTPLVRADYFNQWGMAALQAGHYSEAQGPLSARFESVPYLV